VQHRPVTILFSLLCIAATGCKRETPVSPAPQTGATVNATPVIDGYRALWDQVDQQQLILTAHVYPNRAALEFDDMTPPGERERLVAFLLASQPVLQGVIEQSRLTPEPFPPEPSLDEGAGLNAHMQRPRAWFQNFARLLSADASRCWEAGDATGAAERVAATIRLGNAMCGQPDELNHLVGAGFVGSAAQKAVALFDAGLVQKATPDSLNELRDAAAASMAGSMAFGADATRQINAALQTIHDRLSDGG